MSIETFQLVKERCLLVNMNLRAEMKGEEHQPGMDLAFEFSSANNLLLKLHPELRAAFYKSDDVQQSLDQDFMPNLRFPLMSPFSWELEIPRTLLRIHDPEGGNNDIVFGNGKTNKFHLSFLAGGTVKWKFRVQFSAPDTAASGRLMNLIQQQCTVSLACADEEEAQDNFEQAETITREPMSEARKEAEGMFGNAPVDGEVVDAEFIPTANHADDELAYALAAVVKGKRTSKKMAEIE